MSTWSLDPFMSKMETPYLEQPCILHRQRHTLYENSLIPSQVISYGKKRLARLYILTNYFKAVWHIKIIYACSIIISHLSKGQSHQEFNDLRIHHSSVQILTYTGIRIIFTVSRTNGSLSLSSSYRLINRDASRLNWLWLLTASQRS